MSLVYLAGPITGLSFHGCTEWRDAAIELLAEHGITGLSPMRAKDYLLEESNLKDSYDGDDPDFWLSTAKAIVARDRFDCQRADMVLINTLGAERVSIGTMIEAGWADSARVPIALAYDKGGVHDHAMLTQLAGWETDSLEKAVETCIAVLGKG